MIKKRTADDVQNSFGHRFTFWLNVGAFTTGAVMMACGVVAAYAQSSVEPPASAASMSHVPAQTSVGSPTLASKKTADSGIDAKSSSSSTEAPKAVLHATPKKPSVRKAAQSKPSLLVLPKVTLYQGEVRVIRQPKVARIAVGNGALVKTTIVDDRQIVLVAEAAGDTTVHLWYASGLESRFEVQVQTLKTSSVLDEVNALIKPFPSVKARIAGQSVVLEGRYPDADSAIKLKALAEKLPVIVNLIPDAPIETITVHPEPMIYLDLRVIEVKKSSLDQLGIRWATTAAGPVFSSAANIYSNARFPNMTNPGYPVVNSNRPVVAALGFATQITSMLDFLEQNGDGWTLAEPRLSCQSGGVSEFLAGGEIPIPVASGFGQVDVTYKKYGIVIKFEPKADLKDNISSKISVEVSQPDPSNSINNFVAFTTNSTSTEVAMRPNVPLVISGLLRIQNSKSLQGIPGLSNLPILGGMFRTKEVRNEQTELLVVVTPRIGRRDSDVDALRKAQERADHINKIVSDRLVN